MTVALFVGYGLLGLVIPTTSVLAMEEHGEIAGTASALMGTLHMVTGVAAMTVSGFFANGLPLPMVTGIAACAAIALLLTHGDAEAPAKRSRPPPRRNKRGGCSARKAGFARPHCRCLRLAGDSSYRRDDEIRPLLRR